MNKNTKIIVDKNFYLKTLKADNVSKDYVKWLNDYEVSKYTEQKYIKHNLKNVELYVTKMASSDSHLLFGIFVNQLHIGNVKLGPIKWEHKSADISYFIGDKKYWGKGLATKSVKNVVKFAIEKLGIEKINAGYYEVNKSSEKVLKKCGFEIEGIKKKEILFEGKRINKVLVGFSGLK